jgi:hypothetical protein
MQLSTQRTALIFGGATYEVPPVGGGEAPPEPAAVAAVGAASAHAPSVKAATTRKRSLGDGSVLPLFLDAYGVS